MVGGCTQWTNRQGQHHERKLNKRETSGKGGRAKASLARQMHAVNQMNVRGSQARRGMREMEWDRRRRDGGTHGDGGEPRCGWKDHRREAGGTEAAEG